MSGSIVDYSSLQTAVANWLQRSDLTSRIQDGIQLAEAKMNRKLRTKDMEVRDSAFPIAGEYVGLPNGFGGVNSFYLNTSPRGVLKRAPPDYITTNYGDGNTGEPKFYSIGAGQFRFGPAPDATYTGTLNYFLLVPNLSSTVTTNWMITNHPDAYLYGTLAEVQALAKQWDDAKAWETMLYNVLAEIVGISNRDKWSGGTISMVPG